MKPFIALLLLSSTCEAQFWNPKPTDDLSKPIEGQGYRETCEATKDIPVVSQESVN